MLIRSGRDGLQHPLSSDITPRAVYQGRRALLRAMAAGAGGSVLAAWAGRDALAQAPGPGRLAPLPGTRSDDALSAKGLRGLPRPTGFTSCQVAMPISSRSGL